MAFTRRGLVVAATCLAAWLGSAAHGQPPAAPRAIDPCADLGPALDLDFEAGGTGWSLREAVVDTTSAHHGGKSLRLSRAGDGRGFAVASQVVPIERARGRQVRLRGWVKTADMRDGYAGLWMRADQGRESVAFDNMHDRGLSGNRDWTAVEVAFDVPVEATALIVGALFSGKGTAWVDELTLDISAASTEPVTVMGTVNGPDGAPVEGAIVAAVRYGAMSPASVVVSGADGSFAVAMAPGTYAFTATHRDFAPAYVPPRRVDAAAAVLLALARPAGAPLVGAVTNSSGAPMPGVEVRCYRVSDVEGDLFVTHADDAGRYSIRLLPATHGCSAAQGEERSDVVDVAAGTTAADFVIWQPAPAPQEVVDWIRAAAVPLLTPQAGHGFAEMAPLAKIVGDARIVALGEATHGSREIFQLKHRMLEYLVSELGFTVFAIEANWPESEAVNDYVLTGKGDPAAALAGLYFWTWNTEEVLDLIRWMRQWNAVPGHRQVKFYGFDMQTASVAARELAAVLTKLDPKTGTELEKLRPSFEGSKTGSEPAKTSWGPLKAALERAAARLPAERPRGMPERDWLVARQYVRVLEQWVELNEQESDDFALRDRAMADNLRWIAEVAEPEARIVAWAHNAHVANAVTSRPWMGSHLAKELGDAYLPIGFLFHHGSFQANDYTGARRGLAEFTLGAPLPGTLEDTFARAGWPLAVLDLRRPPAGAVADWLDRRQRMRETGAGFSNEQNMLVSRVLPHEFEAVIYVESTTRARPNPPRNDQARPQAAAAGGGS